MRAIALLVVITVGCGGMATVYTPHLCPAAAAPALQRSFIVSMLVFADAKEAGAAIECIPSPPSISTPPSSDAHGASSAGRKRRRTGRTRWGPEDNATSEHSGDPFGRDLGR